MAMKSLGLAGIAIGCSMSIAVAQNAPPPLTQQQQNLLKTLAARHAATPGPLAPPSTAAITTAGAPLTVGTHIFHATNCGWFVDGNGNQFFFVVPPLADGGGVVFAINNLFVGQALQISCVNAFLFEINVFDAASGAFNQTVSIPHT